MESRKERTSILNAVDKLEALGPQLAPPHMKPLQGEPDLLELRPRQGQSPARAIHTRVDDGFKILSIAETHDDLARATDLARERAATYGFPLGSR